MYKADGTKDTTVYSDKNELALNLREAFADECNGCLDPYLEDADMTLMFWEHFEALQRQVIESNVPIYEFIQKIESKKALFVKRALISYFGESVHGGWEGYNTQEIAALTAFMKDFMLTLDNSGEEEMLCDFNIWSVEIRNKD